MSEVSTEQQVASAIRDQIGSDVWLAVSARQPVLIDRGLRFRFGNRYGAPIHAHIVLEPTDTYRVVVTRTPNRGAKAHIQQVLSEHDQVYAQDLGDLIRAINWGL